jgi:gas vesicle protein
VKCAQFWDGHQIISTYYKLCESCREKGRAANNRRKDKKSAQAKEHYQVYKSEISNRNKKWREENKDKLQAYEKSAARKQKNKKWRENKRIEDRFRFVWYAAKRRAKDNGVPFTISKQDIIDIFPLDGKCPMLGITLQFNNKQSKDDSPSLDRIVPKLGYVPGNILLISYRANRIKNDATVNELESILLFLKNMRAQ